LRTKQRALLGHIGPGWPPGDGRLVRRPSRLAEAVSLLDKLPVFDEADHFDGGEPQNPNCTLHSS
jgi:hypothetical protein